MSRQYSDFQIGQISLFFGMVFGAALTVLLPGPAKLIYIRFQLICTILLLLSLLRPQFEAMNLKRRYKKAVGKVEKSGQKLIKARAARIAIENKYK